MTSPIERMVDAAMRCTKCNASMGECFCWVELQLERDLVSELAVAISDTRTIRELLDQTEKIAKKYRKKIGD